MTTKILFILCAAIIAVVTAVSVDVYGIKYGLLHAIPSVARLVAGGVSGFVDCRKEG